MLDFFNHLRWYGPAAGYIEKKFGDVVERVGGAMREKENGGLIELFLGHSSFLGARPPRRRWRLPAGHRRYHLSSSSVPAQTCRDASQSRLGFRAGCRGPG